jgi:hypothetical protein
VSCAAESIEQEIPEELVILKTHTVANPWTVMIHPHHARITDRTMVGSGWLDGLASETESEFNQVRSMLVEPFDYFLFKLLPLLLSFINLCILSITCDFIIIILLGIFFLLILLALLFI